MVDKKYIKLAKKVLKKGTLKENRTDTKTISLFGERIKIDLSKGFPLLTTKKVWFKGVAHELLWFLSGNTNIKYLKDNKVNIWNDWADENGDLGPVYGKQWRNWNGFDQIKNVIQQLKDDPLSRRHIVNAWNVDDLNKMALPPCHMMFQFNVEEKYKKNNKVQILNCQVYQRSADLFLGVPFNIASYALLTHIIAKLTNMHVGKLTLVFGDVHVYINHVDQIKMQIELYKKFGAYKLPKISLNDDLSSIDEFKFDDIKLIDYESRETIKGAIAV